MNNALNSLSNKENC